MSGSVATQVQKVEVRDVVDVIVTSTEQNEADGVFVREIRVLTQTDDDTQPIETFVLRLVSDERDNINVTAPAVDF